MEISLQRVSFGTVYLGSINNLTSCCLFSQVESRASGYLLYPIVVRSAGYYFITVCRLLDTLVTARYVETGTESSKISKILRHSDLQRTNSKRALFQNRQSLGTPSGDNNDATRARLYASAPPLTTEIAHQLQGIAAPLSALFRWSSSPSLSVVGILPRRPRTQAPCRAERTLHARPARQKQRAPWPRWSGCGDRSPRPCCATMASATEQTQQRRRRRDADAGAVVPRVRLRRRKEAAAATTTAI